MKFALQLLYLVPLRILGILAGFIVVPIALLNRKVLHDRNKVYFVINGNAYGLAFMHYVSLPRWAWLWDNEEEGAASTMEYWWRKFDHRADRYWVMILWSCFRNPANNMRFTKLFSLDFLVCNHKVKTGKHYEYIKSTDTITGREYYSFRYRRTWKLFGYTGDFIFHLGFKALVSTIELHRKQPELFSQRHHRYRGFGIQIIPGKNLRRL